MSKPWPIVVEDQTEGDAAGFLTKCDVAWRHTDADVIAYFHSDLHVLEKDWDQRVLAEFEDDSVAVVGFVGATQLGHPDIYKVPYDFRQLARGDVWSNLTDAEVHGQRETGTRCVAVVDSCAVIVRRKLLVRLDGWPVKRYPNSSHCSDLWICLSALRLNCNIRMVGISCVHRSGGKGEAGTTWLDARGGDAAMHQDAHRLIYSDFKTILPVRVR
jgi:hypothetical protein